MLTACGLNHYDRLQYPGLRVREGAGPLAGIPTLVEQGEQRGRNFLLEQLVEVRG